MKPFLGIDLTLNKKNDQFNGSEFLVQKPSSALSESLEVSTDKAEKTIEKSKLPLPFRIVKSMCGIVALLIASGILKADVSLAEGYYNAPWLFWTAGICVLFWLILWLCSNHKAKSVLDTDESTQTFSHVDGVAHAVYSELAVPDDAKDIDILSFSIRSRMAKSKFRRKACWFSNTLTLNLRYFPTKKTCILPIWKENMLFPYHPS